MRTDHRPFREQNGVCTSESKALPVLIPIAVAFLPSVVVLDLISTPVGDAQLRPTRTLNEKSEGSRGR